MESVAEGILNERRSLYWDRFEERAEETVCAISSGETVPVRRVAVFVTNRCNLKCAYCNHVRQCADMDEATFDSIVKRHQGAVIHVTGGEPSVVPWLYPYMTAHGQNATFHLNTNAVRCPPSEHVKRLKVSLDSSSREYWDSLVGQRGSFDRVVANIKSACPKTVVSITYTLTHENYMDAPRFAEFARDEFPGLYATFFSVYKGRDPRFVITPTDADDFFARVAPALMDVLNEESIALLNETLDEKVRLCTGARFPESDLSEPCWLSLSERVYSWDGSVSACSHLFRDGIKNQPGEKNAKCLYGCNRRLVAFNELVGAKLFDPWPELATLSTSWVPNVLGGGVDSYVRRAGGARADGVLPTVPRP